MGTGVLTVGVPVTEIGLPTVGVVVAETGLLTEGDAVTFAPGILVACVVSKGVVVELSPAGAGVSGVPRILYKGNPEEVNYKLTDSKIILEDTIKWIKMD